MYYFQRNCAQYEPVLEWAQGNLSTLDTRLETIPALSMQNWSDINLEHLLYSRVKHLPSPCVCTSSCTVWYGHFAFSYSGAFPHQDTLCLSLVPDLHACIPAKLFSLCKLVTVLGHVYIAAECLCLNSSNSCSPLCKCFYHLKLWYTTYT